ncbi:MAG: isoprenylcysteine carboxylmethyltransferase family protein [Candidatus Eremiobacterota bacterium]
MAGRHLRAILTLPIVVLVVIPGLLLLSGPPASPGWGLPGGVGLGLGLIAAGLGLMGATIGLFGRTGGGTLAPWDPPTRLVVAGPYRYVRNPMITGVVLVLLGEVVAFGSWRLLVWCLTFAGGNLAWIPLVEEPPLRARFGESYAEYCRHVPRWIPRLTPYDPGD